METIKDIAYGALVLLGVAGLVGVGITYWNIIGPILAWIFILAVCATIGDMVRR